MASVFSYSATSFHLPSDLNYQPTQYPRANRGFHSPHYFPESSLTVELICLPIATIANPLIRNAPHPFMEPRQMTSAHP
jgi:hypothetical protein